ncbi:coniferyl aldehyde dehydrogenase [Acinetobacter proteolyticus]|uniref:Aldehyde dehydrogenase n=1 Tax=Acinetobacter proteolyticus TaxID=1776741 RepID=A0A2N0WAZ4_9GAMM|nr:coniferyl aldehyde dehydrogenase [Acinetobacter proteolyticus]PKF31669.1 coniferyl-aldehyde dehydrogenase [Acinetobacter proteolyticus]
MKLTDKDLPTRNSAIKNMENIFFRQVEAAIEQPYPEITNRRNKLILLKKQIIRYQDVISLSISKDFSSRSLDESKLMDLLSSIFEIDHAIKNIRHWARSSKRKTELLFKSNSLEILYQPKGVVGIIVPWNFPVYLALGPLIASITAGNRVMIKLSEFTPITNSVIKKMISEVFNENEVAVFGEEISDPSKFTNLPFNHIIFTGSPAVGRIVMRSASENLTPVTLELGGKSPALVTENYPISDAAKRILHGKTANSGQICIAPDYALVPKNKIDQFVLNCKSSFCNMFGQDISENSDYTSIINDKHLKRIQDMLKDAEEKGATIIPCAEYKSLEFPRRMPTHIILNCTTEMKIMKEELFGPILPVVEYETLSEAINFIKSNERPLALYCFSHNQEECDLILKHTHSGGVTINDWGWHAINHDAPFGGIGNSGIGSYHGIEGFHELSHAKTIFKRHRLFPTQLFYPPYGTWLQKIIIRFFLKKADPNLK